VAAGEVHDTIGGAGFVHGLTYSHHVVGAAAGREVLRVLRERRLVEAASTQGKRLLAGLAARLGDHRAAGDVRGLGLMVAVELVADRAARTPFPRGRRVAERVVAAARDRGLLLYWSTGCADGGDGDLVMLGPPLVVTDAEVDELVDTTAAAVEAVAGEVAPA
jgi:adenosylmethionine-8-amino-7-oxononanoate aminotransferase